MSRCLCLYTRQNYPMDFLSFFSGAQLRPVREELSTNEVSMPKGLCLKTVLVRNDSLLVFPLVSLCILVCMYYVIYATRTFTSLAGEKCLRKS